MEWPPKGVGDVQGEYIDKYPPKSESGEWLLGTWEDGRALYYNSKDHTTTVVERDESNGLSVIDIGSIQEDLSLREWILIERVDSTFCDTWSRYSWPFYHADGLANSILTDEQAVAYAFREIYELGRGPTAELLRKSPNTVDNQLAVAKRKLDDAIGLLRSAKRAEDLIDWEFPILKDTDIDSTKANNILVDVWSYKVDKSMSPGEFKREVDEMVKAALNQIDDSERSVSSEEYVSALEDATSEFRQSQSY